MTRRPAPARTTARPRTDRTTRSVAAAEFKTRCLELLNRVRETGADYVVTKYGRPVARVVPYRASGARALFGALKGTVVQYDWPFDPIDGEYDIDRD
jgi:prevent-host-death family protein